MKIIWEITFEEQQVQELRRLMSLCGIEDPHEFVNVAFTHMKWLIERSQRQDSIIALAEDELSYTELASPALQGVRDRSRLRAISSKD